MKTFFLMFSRLKIINIILFLDVKLRRSTGELSSNSNSTTYSGRFYRVFYCARDMCYII